MELKLKVTEGKHAGQDVSVSSPKFFIGRAEDCHLRPASDLISRHHCVLLIEEGYAAVRDFGSKNGTYVNDERVVGERELHPGDRLKVGPLSFEVHFSHGIAAKKRPPVAGVQEAAARAADVASSSGVDVSQWLSEEHAPTKEKSAADTQRLAFSDTSITLSSTRAVPETAQPEPAAAGADEPSPDQPAKSKTPGKLPPIPKDLSKDSREAAAKVLAQFRKRR